MRLIEIPLTFLRDYTTPMADHESWDRRRAAIIPATLLLSFFYLFGLLNDPKSPTLLWVGLIAIVPGAMIGAAIKFKTKKT